MRRNNHLKRKDKTRIYYYVLFIKNKKCYSDADIKISNTKLKNIYALFYKLIKRFFDKN